MVSGATLGAGLIWVAIIYWILAGNALQRLFQRLWQSITMDRALTVGGFTGGLVWGNVAIKIVAGFIGGLGALSLGGVLDLSALQFSVIVAVMIVAFAVTRESDDDGDD